MSNNTLAGRRLRRQSRRHADRLGRSAIACRCMNTWLAFDSLTRVCGELHILLLAIQKSTWSCLAAVLQIDFFCVGRIQLDVVSLEAITLDVRRVGESGLGGSAANQANITDCWVVVGRRFIVIRDAC
jgi:hypothetical protein